MKIFTLKAFQMWCLLMLMTATAFAQTGFEPVTILVDKSAQTGNLPPMINSNATNRGAGFNGQYVFVASRQDGNHVYYWNIDNPETPSELDLTGVAGGTFTLSDLAVVNNHVFVSNMTFAGGEFKVYHWSSLTAQPSVLLNYPNAPARLGDAISIIGNPETNALLIASGHGTKNFYVWNIASGAIANPEPTVYNFPNIAGANFGRITKVMNEDLYLASGSQFGLQLLSPTMDTLASVQAGYFPYWSMYPYIFYYNSKRYLAYIHVKDAPAENKLYVLDISEAPTTLQAVQTMMTVPFANRVVYELSLGANANGNASVGLDVLADNGGNIWIMAYAAANGFVVQKVGNYPVGVAERNRSSFGFDLFPNPAANQVTIVGDKSIDKIEILDMAGRLRMQLQPAAAEISLSTTDLTPGVYMIRVSTEGAVSTRKLFINK